MLSSSMASVVRREIQVGEISGIYRSLDSEKRGISFSQKKSWAKWAGTTAFLAWLDPEDSEAIMKSDMSCDFECDDWWSLIR